MKNIIKVIRTKQTFKINITNPDFSELTIEQQQALYQLERVGLATIEQKAIYN